MTIRKDGESWVETEICIGCVKEFQSHRIQFMGKTLFVQRYCESCLQRQKTEMERKLRQDRQMEFQSICPEEFWDTDIHDNRINGKAIEQVLEWKFGLKGMLIHGPTRRGKTRSVWLLLRYQFHLGRGFKWMTAADFCERSSDAAGNGQSSEFTESLISTSILFIDDVGKGRMTERNAGAFFNVLDKRFNNRKPVIMTMNMSGAELEKRFDGDMAKPLLSRIQEFCDTVQF